MNVFTSYGRRYALIDEDDLLPYARTTIGFTAREYPDAPPASPGSPGPAEPLEDAKGAWIEGSCEGEEEGQP